VRFRPAICFSLLAVVALAGNSVSPWHGKGFKDWTAEDARAVMTNSPWAGRMPAPAAGRPPVMVIENGANGAPPPSASLGNPSNTTTGNNMSVAANPGSAGPADVNGAHNLPTTQTPSGLATPVGAPDPPSFLSVVWASATPVRLAILKLRSGTSPPSEEQISRAHHPDEYYVVAVSGLASPDRDIDPTKLAPGASLTVKGKPPLIASESSYRQIGNSNVYFFRFRREGLPLSLSDDKVEFKVLFGTAEIKRKFVLRDMEFEGHLAL